MHRLILDMARRHIHTACRLSQLPIVAMAMGLALSCLYRCLVTAAGDLEGGSIGNSHLFITLRSGVDYENGS